MPFAPGDFYDVADRIFFERPLDPNHGECVRTVAGRIYYSAYLATRETLRTLSGDPEYELEHTELAHFLSYGVDDGWVAEFGQRFESLRRQRTTADYRPAAVLEKRIVGFSIRDARYILDNQLGLETRLRAWAGKLPVPKKKKGY